jgi:hypothetical protein
VPNARCLIRVSLRCSTRSRGDGAGATEPCWEGATLLPPWFGRASAAAGSASIVLVPVCIFTGVHCEMSHCVWLHVFVVKRGEVSHEAPDPRGGRRGGSGLCAPHVVLLLAHRSHFFLKLCEGLVFLPSCCLRVAACSTLCMLHARAVFLRRNAEDAQLGSKLKYS